MNRSMLSWILLYFDFFSGFCHAKMNLITHSRVWKLSTSAQATEAIHTTPDHHRQSEDKTEKHNKAARMEIKKTEIKTREKSHLISTHKPATLSCLAANLLHHFLLIHWLTPIKSAHLMWAPRASSLSVAVHKSFFFCERARYFSLAWKINALMLSWRWWWRNRFRAINIETRRARKRASLDYKIIVSSQKLKSCDGEMWNGNFCERSHRLQALTTDWKMNWEFHQRARAKHFNKVNVREL